MTHNRSVLQATLVLSPSPSLAYMCKEHMELKLEANRRQTRRLSLRTNTNHGIDSFILKFPPEIASHIFFFSMIKRDYEPDSLSLKKLPTPYILGSVCRGWRHLALSTPRLWSTISFTLSKPPPKAKNLEALLQLIEDWLHRSRSTPLKLWVFKHIGREPPLSEEQCGPIIDALNRHSGRWHTLCLALTNPSLFRLFCGTSPPSNLRRLHLTSPNRGKPPIFKMNSRPSPIHLGIQNMSISNIDVIWENVQSLYLKASHRSLDFNACIELMQRAPSLKFCSLVSTNMTSGISTTHLPQTPQTIVKHTRLRKLELLSCCPVDTLSRFLDSMELPSLEELHYQGDTDILAKSVVSLINRSGIPLKVLKLRLDEEEPAMEDINTLLNAVPYLQTFQLRLQRSGPRTAFIMDDLFIQLSSSPPVLEDGATPGLLLNLRSLKLYSGEGYKFDCIPDIFSWPHRKMLHLLVDGSRPVVLDDDTTRKVTSLVAQGRKIRILRNGKYFSN
ncbi:hypothetical protein M413DRAFT_32372 [Hebeloma cylindrosporum]|uniref:Uncharacterized protein n=1 Tax=Hebeloma cylindrosporum TaxID=76867 RepID=A0A0C3BW51_HEBCY|nr:hypothetical protein M413DRAFT_32372 [Hebeloma cylindrosporum h7]